MKLTSRQEQVLDVIRQYLADTGYPPTRADIARELGFKSANAAEEHLRALARKGAIEMIAGASRGIRLTESTGLPIVGRVAAGSPILATEHIEDYCELSAQFFSPPADFLLRVAGDSRFSTQSTVSSDQRKLRFSRTLRGLGLALLESLPNRPIQ